MRAAAVPLLAALAACGGGQRPGPPRSTCADAAASITRALRVVAAEHADGVAELEPRFAAACRDDAWRPALVRCFALARDPAEHRVCIRRLEPGQRAEARAIQTSLYPASRRAPSPASRIADSCQRLAPVREALLGCDRLPPPYMFEMLRSIDAVLRAAVDAAIGQDTDLMAEVAMDCERRADEMRAVLTQVGC